ncbi:MAG: HAD-IA family hydrolase [Smithellaceae bacterium]|nr:HAD-IA family hydrolase [Smithellaceae bacterium]
MKQVDIMIFDFDGTLVSSGGDIATAVNHTLGWLGLPLRELSDIVDFIGDGVQVLIERALGDGNKDRYQEAMAIFSAYYEQHMLDTTRIYPGVKDVLEYFRGKRKWIVTNKRYIFTKKIVDSLGLAPYFEGIVGADSTLYKKPDPRILSAVATDILVDPERTAVIGDGENDVRLAKNAGAYSCVFLGGLGRRDALLALEPDCVYERAEELMGLFS